MKSILGAAIVACTMLGRAAAGENMKIQIQNMDFIIQTDDNDTVADIIANLPLSLDIARYDGHEYFATLPFTPRATAPRTSHLLPGHVYYWAPGNAFVVNFADADISPYSSVHIGSITDATATEILRTAGNNIRVTVTK